MHTVILTHNFRYKGRYKGETQHASDKSNFYVKLLLL